MVKQSDLAISYLVAVGAGLFGVVLLALFRWASNNQLTMGPHFLFGLLCGAFVGFGFLVSGYILSNSEFSEARPTRIAIWGTIGLGLPTFFVLGAPVVFDVATLSFGWTHVAMIGVSGGGVVGILSGTLIELHDSHDRTSRLHRRNTVYLRLFRHDIRNSITVIKGHLDLLEREQSSISEAAPAMHEQLDQIVRLSDACHKLDTLAAMDELQPIDLSALTDERVEQFRANHPEVRVETAITPNQVVGANPLLGSVVENVLLNAVEHNIDAPTVSVDVSPDAAGWVTLVIEDDGPGFTEETMAVYEQGFETALHHSDGVGLWIAHWIVAAFDGSVSLENTRTGAKVTVRLRQWS